MFLTKSEVRCYSIDMFLLSQGELEWESAGNASSIVLTRFANSPFIYKFGLSAQSLVGSTGIAWSTCIHDITVGKFRKYLLYYLVIRVS